MVKTARSTQTPKNWPVFPIVVGLIILLSACLRLFNLDRPDQYIFDEDYFAFTSALMAGGQVVAYQFWHQPFSQLSSSYLYRPPAVEWLHPPVAKLLMATSIKLAGNHPLGWRLAPALSGIALVIITIWLSRKIFSSQPTVALLAGFLVATDPLLVTESRLAGANMILTLLTTMTVLLSYIFWQKIKNDQPQHKTWLYLILLGWVAGLAIATKWSAAFIWSGIWTWLGWRLYLSPIKNKLSWLGPKMVIFLIVTGLVYLLSYSQYFYLTKLDLAGWRHLQSAMVTYQTTTAEQHTFQSRPWQWPLGQVKIPYFLPSKQQVGQSAVWAGSRLIPLGWLALAITLIQSVTSWRTKKKKSVEKGQSLLILTILGFWLPWFFIPRNLFLYHMLPIWPLLLILLSRRLVGLSQWLASTVKRPKR